MPRRTMVRYDALKHQVASEVLYGSARLCDVARQYGLDALAGGAKQD